MPGSVTTYPGKNPDYRVYTIDGLHENSTYVSHGITSLLSDSQVLWFSENSGLRKLLFGLGRI